MADNTALITRDEAGTALDRPGFLKVDTFEQACKVAEFISKSQLVPDAYRGKPADIVIAMQLGMEVGIAPLQALQSIAVINGRPSLWGDAVKGLVIGHRDCVDFVEDEPQGDTPEAWTATCTITRRGKTPVTRSFSWADAKKAGLSGKRGPWSEYPKRMLMMRARGFAVRDAFPDLLRGIVTAEEAQDYDMPTAPVISEPKRVGSNLSPEQVPQTAPSDGAAPTPAPAASSTGAAPSPSLVAPQEQATTITVMEVYRDESRKVFRVVAESGEEFVTRDPDVYAALAPLAGGQASVGLTYKVVPSRSGDDVSVIVSVDGGAQ